MTNLERELANVKGEIERTNTTTKQFPPSVEKGKYAFPTDETYNIPDGIIAHLTRGMRRERARPPVVDVTYRSFEKKIYAANLHSWVLMTNLIICEKCC